MNQMLPQSLQSFPLNPQPGQTFGQWVWTGSMWACQNPGPTCVVQKFAPAGSYSYFPTAGMTFATIECWGGGGGGGSAGPSLSVSEILGGGGGGSGGYSRLTLPLAAVRGGVVVTVGAGGLGGTTIMVPGARGGVTSFGALCMANGGDGGSGNDLVTGYGPGGPGAQPGIGDVALAGSTGEPGLCTSVNPPLQQAVSGGRGGGIMGGVRTNDTFMGLAQAGPESWAGAGAGGCGGIVNQLDAGEAPGGQGGSGSCVVTDYCFGQTGTVEFPCPPGQPCPPY